MDLNFLHNMPVVCVFKGMLKEKCVTSLSSQ